MPDGDDQGAACSLACDAPRCNLSGPTVLSRRYDPLTRTSIIEPVVASTLMRVMPRKPALNCPEVRQHPRLRIRHRNN